MKNKRLTPTERIALAKECKHNVFRYRNRSTEQVCSVCGAVRLITPDAHFGIKVVKDWELEKKEPEPTEDSPDSE